eukprot:scaffold683_cov124-Cylindrotheca_fusiformis.AAC.33
MKLSSFALAIAAVGSIDAKRTQINSKVIESKLKRATSKQDFLQMLRKLQDDESGDNDAGDDVDVDDDDGGENDSSFEISGDYSIRFNSCISMHTVADEDNQENNNNRYKDYEGATSVKEVLIVDLVSSDSSVPVQELAMDIGTFVTTIGTMVHEQVESYCTVCEEIFDSCADGTAATWSSTSNSSSVVSDEGTTIEFVTCETCALYNCNGYNDRRRNLNEENQGDMESALSYLTELAECQAFSFSYENAEYAEDYEEYEQQQAQEEDGNQAQGQGIYISYTCNQYGTGIDLGFFLDDECTVLNPQESVSEHIPENSVAGQYLMMAKSLVEGIFLNSFSCKSIEFASPYAQNDDADENNDYENEAEDSSSLEGNEYCQAVLEDENTMLMESCSDSTSAQTGNSKGNYTWYSIDEEDGDGDALAVNEAEICQAISDIKSNYAKAYGNRKKGAGGLFDFTYYKSQSSNQRSNGGYDYRSFGKLNEEHRAAANRKSLGSVLLFVFGAVGIAAGVAYVVLYKKKEPEEEKKQSLILEGDASDYKAEGEIA